MNYNRTISNELSQLLEKGGKLRWLFDYVKNRADLDFLIGKNKGKEWISIYRGLSCILKITQLRDKSKIKLDADNAYKKIGVNIYSDRNPSVQFKVELDDLLLKVSSLPQFNQYYDNKKEGFYQNELSRKYGICSQKTSDFVIIDKEAVIEYDDQNEKNNKLGKFQNKYKILQSKIKKWRPKHYNKNLYKKSFGNELDFLALHKNGDILLIEYKDRKSTDGIYSSPLQIGMYYDLFKELKPSDLTLAVHEMLEQKKKIGLINPDWKSQKISGDIIPVLIISNYNYKSSGQEKYDEIIKFIRSTKASNKFLKDIRTFNYTSNNGLNPW